MGSGKKEKTTEWTKEVLAGVGEFLEFMVNPGAHANLSQISRIGYGEWKDKEAFYDYIRERNRVLKARRDSSKKIYHALWRLEKQKLIRTKQKSKGFLLELTWKGFLKLLLFRKSFSKVE